MKRIFVTATNTNIGKTYTTKLLLGELASRGIRVGAIKPIETGVVDVALDADEILTCLKRLNYEFEYINLDDIAPITYKLPAAPFVASGNAPLDLKLLDAAVEKLEKLCDLLIIEGAGGLYTPIDENFMMIDLISHFNASALLVTHCSLGCINDTLLSKKALDDRKIEYAIAFNCRENDTDFSITSEDYFLKSGFNVLRVDENIKEICDILLCASLN